MQFLLNRHYEFSCGKQAFTVKVPGFFFSLRYNILYKEINNIDMEYNFNHHYRKQQLEEMFRR